VSKPKTAAQLDAEIKAAFNGAKHGVLARRKTADDKVVLLHADGTLTWALGSAIKGSPAARTAAGIEEALTAGWIVLGEVELFDAAEVPHLIETARKAAHRGGESTLPGNVRKAVHRDKPIKPHWVTVETDRAGNPTLRVWKLSRMSHPGLAVWDSLGHHRGRYEIMQESLAGGLGQRSGGGTYAPTGVRFHDLNALSKYLRETSQLMKG
jgi:hypothetical protein